MLEWQTKGLKWGRRAVALREVVHTKVVYRYVDEFRDVGMSRVYTEAKWACYKTDGTTLREILSLAEQHVFVHNLDNDPTSSVSEGIEDKMNNRKFEGMVTGNEVTSSSNRG